MSIKTNVFNRNISELVTLAYKEKLIKFNFLKKFFLDIEFEHATFYFSKIKEELTSQVNVDTVKVEYLKKIIKEKNLSEYYEEEYLRTLIQSNRSHDELVYAFENGMKLHQSNLDLVQFKKYIEYVDNLKIHRVKKALKNINEIYDYSTIRTFLPFNPFSSPHKQFLAQAGRLRKFKTRRIIEIERGLKLQQKNGVVQEIDDVIRKEANGTIVKLKEKLGLKKKIDKMAISDSLRKRAILQAKHETNIYRKMLNGCNSGSSQRLESAAKKIHTF